jgi:hypothetical protein
MLHYVTPVACGIAYAQKDGLIFSSGFFQSLRPPGIPINGIVSVLEKIGTGFIDQTVRVFVL